MIIKTDKTVLSENAKGSVTSRIKLLCDSSSVYYKTDEGYFMHSGESAVLFGITELSPEIMAFFSLTGVKKIMGGDFFLPCDDFTVMEACGGGNPCEETEIKPAAEMISRTFSLSFSDVYASLCSKVNRGTASVIYTGFSAAVLLKSREGCLLTSVCSEKKGYGKKAVAAAVNSAPGKVFLLCEKSLVPFYEKSGFHTVGHEKEYIL